MLCHCNVQCKPRPRSVRRLTFLLLDNAAEPTANLAVVERANEEYFRGMGIVAFALVDLAFLLVTGSIGLSMLVHWWRQNDAGFPTFKLVTHAILQVTSIALWVSFIVTQELALAWTTFTVITVGQTLGDLVMFASYRSRMSVVGSVPYFAAARDVLSFRRPAPAVHAICGAIAWFGMLAICIAATVTA